MALMDGAEIAKKTMVIFFVVNTSKSMKGSKIRTVNDAIEKLIPEIRRISAECADAQIKIAVLEYCTGVRWITAGGPVEADKFIWEELEAGGDSDFGAACKALNEKLSSKAFMGGLADFYSPAIFWFTDSAPSDNWALELELLKQNGWFKHAIKVAIAIGEEANKDILREFTGTMETVLEFHNTSMLMKFIKFVSIDPEAPLDYPEKYIEYEQRFQGISSQREMNANIQRITANLPKIIGHLQQITAHLQGITAILQEPDEENAVSFDIDPDVW